MHTTQETLNAGFTISPRQLIVARKRVPFYENEGYIPLMIFGLPFTKVEPILTPSGDLGVTMSMMGKPFGFIEAQQGNEEALEATQKTNGLILEPHATQTDRWLATFETPEPLTDFDLSMFSYGICFYAQEAVRQLRKGPPPNLPPAPPSL